MKRTSKPLMNLHAELNKMGVVNNLMNIRKAGEICEEKDPSRASEFFRAIDDILKAFNGRKRIKSS